MGGAATLIQLIFSPNPLPALSPPYKEVGLRGDVKTVFEGTSPAFFSDPWHPNKAPTLSVLVSTYWFW